MKNEFVLKGLIIAVFLNILFGITLITSSGSNLENLSLGGIAVFTSILNLILIVLVSLRIKGKKGDLIKLQLGQVLLGLLVVAALFISVGKLNASVFLAIVLPYVVILIAIGIFYVLRDGIKYS